jgi:hypothetical protein
MSPSVTNHHEDPANLQEIQDTKEGRQQVLNDEKVDLENGSRGEDQDVIGRRGTSETDVENECQYSVHSPTPVIAAKKCRSGALSTTLQGSRSSTVEEE